MLRSMTGYGRGEATVDGIHPTDLGFARMAAAIGHVLQEALRTVSATSTS